MSTSGNRSQSMNVTGGEEIVGRINRKMLSWIWGQMGDVLLK